MKRLFKRLSMWLSNGRHIRRMTWYDVVTGKEWDIDFVFVAFPGLKTMGYRVEGFHQTVKPCKEHQWGVGEFMEFGTIIIEDGELKVINW